MTVPLHRGPGHVRQPCLTGSRQRLPHRCKHRGQDGNVADEGLERCSPQQALNPQEHCVHLLQVRECPADVTPPPEAFEVWVVHRSLCRFCCLGSADDGTAHASGLSLHEQGRGVESKRSSSSSSGTTSWTLGSQWQPKPQRQASAPLSRNAARQSERQKLLLARRDRAQHLAVGDCASELVLLSRQTNIALDQVRELKDLFDESDMQNRGLLDRKEFCKLLRSVGLAKQDAEIPDHLLDLRWFEPNVAGGEGGRTIDFEGFLRWYQANSFDQTLMAPGVSGVAKTLARKFGLDLAFVESIYHVFLEFDEEGNKAINYRAFRRLVLRLLKAEEEEVSETMVGRLWLGATKQGSIDEIDFETFLLWYTQHFGDTVRRKTGVPLLQEFYRSFRPVAGVQRRNHT